MTDKASRRLAVMAIAIGLTIAGAAATQSRPYVAAASTPPAAEPRQTFPQPTADPGPVRIAGNVNVANVPHVLAEQIGEWTVSLAGQPTVFLTGRPTVILGGPGFLQADREYRFVWSDGQAETYRVLGTAAEGWVRGELVAGEQTRAQRWINPQLARAIEEVRQTAR